MEIAAIFTKVAGPRFVDPAPYEQRREAFNRKCCRWRSKRTIEAVVFEASIPEMNEKRSVRGRSHFPSVFICVICG